MVDSARIKQFKSLKGQRKIVCLTAYSAPMTCALDPHCDLLLFGDSVAMVLYGMETTQGAAATAFHQAVVSETSPLKQHLFWPKQ